MPIDRQFDRAGDGYQLPSSFGCTQVALLMAEAGVNSPTVESTPRPSCGPKNLVEVSGVSGFYR